MKKYIKSIAFWTIRMIVWIMAIGAVCVSMWLTSSFIVDMGCLFALFILIKNIEPICKQWKLSWHEYMDYMDEQKEL